MEKEQLSAVGSHLVYGICQDTRVGKGDVATAFPECSAHGDWRPEPGSFPTPLQPGLTGGSGREVPRFFSEVTTVSGPWLAPSSTWLSVLTLMAYGQD
jgi:hypothetical protein